MNPRRVLIIEDDDNLRQVIRIQLEREGYDAKSAASAEQAIPILEKSPQHLVITDLNLPGMSGLDLLKRIRVEYPETAVIVMTAFGTVQSAVDAMKAGAYDYITKPIHPYALKALVRRSIDHHQLLEEVQVLRSCLDRKYGFEEIVGSSPAMLQPLDVAARVAATDATVLIYGETGTGKELVAKAIHLRSNRREQPFVTINCGAIPRELLESELFGHVKGSFTGALTHKKGRIEMADRGTVLLDEVGEMPLELQVRILRLIQEREIEKVGATAPTKVDVRLIAATHRNLAAMVNEGKFREDLYYRLLGLPIELPPLRERGNDILILAHHFIENFCAENGLKPRKLSEKAQKKLLSYNFPGNIRELKSVTELAVTLSNESEIDSSDIILDAGSSSAYSPDDELTLKDYELKIIKATLNKYNNDIRIAAGKLDIGVSTIYRILKDEKEANH